MSVFSGHSRTCLSTSRPSSTRLAHDRLEAEDLILELADRPSLGETQTLSRLLHCGDHGWGTANQDLDVAGGRRKLLLDHVGSDKTNTAGPALRWVVQDVVYAELGVPGGKRIEVVLEKNVVGVDVCEDEIDFSLVAGGATAVDGLDNLQHGGNTGATSDHTEMPDHVGCVDHGTLGALDLHPVADLKVRNVLGDVTGRVRLDQEIKKSLVVIGGGRSVRANDFLRLAFDVGGERDMLADRETEDVVLLGQLEAVATRIRSWRTGGVTWTYMAVLWERTVFSPSSNSWKTSGFNTLRSPPEAVSKCPNSSGAV